MKYVKMGEKKGGRYVKAEELSLQEFWAFLSGIISYRLKEPDYGFWSRITGRTKKQELFNVAYIEGYKDAKEDVYRQIEYTVEIDKKGKKVFK